MKLLDSCSCLCDAVALFKLTYHIKPYFNCHIVSENLGENLAWLILNIRLRPLYFS